MRTRSIPKAPRRCSTSRRGGYGFTPPNSAAGKSDGTGYLTQALSANTGKANNMIDLDTPFGLFEAAVRQRVREMDVDEFKRFVVETRPPDEPYPTNNEGER